MKKVLIIISFCLSVACQDQHREKIRLSSQLDSLQAVMTEQDIARQEVEDYMRVIVSAIDSIKVQENILTLPLDETGRVLSKKEIRNNLTLLEELIRRQRDRIAELESQLAAKGQDSTSHYRQLIMYLNDQLEQKNRQIASLKQDLSRKDRRIEELGSEVSGLKQDVQNLEQQTKEQEDLIQAQQTALLVQDEHINRGYLLVETQKRLQELKVIGKGASSKKNINYATLDASIFTPIDIRVFQEIQLKSKNPKVLSAHPANSYRFEKTDKEHSTLIISDPQRFWELTVYLIIQL